MEAKYQMKNPSSISNVGIPFFCSIDSAKRIYHLHTTELKSMDISSVVIVTNTLVVLATLLATVYRIKIEREQIYTLKRNVQAIECLDSLRKYVKTERNSLGSIDKKDINEFFDYLENLGEF